MIIDVCSDLHGFFPKTQGGDLLIVAGDLTAKDDFQGYFKFYAWLHQQKYKHYIFIAGNHDGLIENGVALTNELANTTYLEDSGMDYQHTWTDERGLLVGKNYKIWGSPWTLWFPEINPRCSSFTGAEEDLAKKFELIPEDTDILITHSPPYGIMDYSLEVTKWGTRATHCGSLALMQKARSLPNLKLFVFGHIHECYGALTPEGIQECEERYPRKKPTCKSMPYIVNASHVDENYEPVNPPIRIEL